MKTQLNFQLFNLINGKNRDACVNEDGVFIKTNEGDYKIEITPITRSEFSRQWSFANDLEDHLKVCRGFLPNRLTGKIVKCDRCALFLTDEIATRYANELATCALIGIN